MPGLQIASKKEQRDAFSVKVAHPTLLLERVGAEKRKRPPHRRVRRKLGDEQARTRESSTFDDRMDDGSAYLPKIHRWCDENGAQLPRASGAGNRTVKRQRRNRPVTLNDERTRFRVSSFGGLEQLRDAIDVRSDSQNAPHKGTDGLRIASQERSRCGVEITRHRDCLRCGAAVRA